MAGEWKETTIGEQVLLQRGFDITKLHQRSGSVPVVSTAGVLSFHDTAMARGPGVILGRKGNGIGRAHFVEQDYWPHDTTLWVKDFKGNDAKFVFYFFRQMFKRLNAMDVGSANPTLNRNHVHPIRTYWPPLTEQKAIAQILGTLDDKIELNRRTNATLEAMARALFKSWFAEFDPVRAKLDDRKPVGLDPATAALFSDRFQDSPLGPIPQGWSIGKLGDIGTISRVTINPGDFPQETFDHFSLPAFDNGRRPTAELGSAIMSNKLLVTPNSVLLSKLNPHIPRIWLPDLHPARRSICSTEFVVACSRPGVSREYLFSQFTSSSFASVYGTLVTGTTGSHQRIRPESLLDMHVVIPSPALIEAFTDFTTPMFGRINRNVEQSRTLALK